MEGLTQTGLEVLWGDHGELSQGKAGKAGPAAELPVGEERSQGPTGGRARGPSRQNEPTYRLRPAVASSEVLCKHGTLFLW